MSQTDLWPWDEYVLSRSVDDERILNIIRAVLDKVGPYRQIGEKDKEVRFGHVVQTALFAVGNAKLFGSGDEGVLVLRLARNHDRLRVAIVQYPYEVNAELPSMTQGDAVDLLNKLEVALRAALHS